MAKERNKEEVKLEAGKIFGVMSYVWILCFIPLILKPKNEFVRHHAKQGLVLFIFEIILMVIGVVPLIGWLLAFCGWLLALLLSVMGIVNVLADKKWEMPVFGKYAEKLKF